MSAIGLNLGGEFTRVTVLDAVGELLEESLVRSTEAGFRQRFASLPPSLIAVEYDYRYAALLAMLSSMGHSLLLSGPVPERLLPALAPAVEQFVGQGQRCGTAYRSLVLHSASNGASLGFWVEIDSAQRACSSWYFIGPLPPGTDLGAVELAGFEAVAGVSAFDQARRLHLLASMGELPLELYRRDVAA